MFIEGVPLIDAMESLDLFEAWPALLATVWHKGDKARVPGRRSPQYVVSWLHRGHVHEGHARSMAELQAVLREIEDEEGDLMAAFALYSYVLE